MKSIKCRRRGFTLLEIILSITVLTVMAAGSMSAWANMQTAGLRNRVKAQALFFAEKKMADIKSGFQNAKTAVVVPVTEPPDEGDPGIEVDGLSGGEMWVVVDHIKPSFAPGDPVPSHGLKKVTVRVKWSGDLPEDCPSEKCMVELKSYVYRGF